MKKLFAVLMALVFIVGCFASCGKPEEVQAAEPTTKAEKAAAKYAEVKKIAEKMVKDNDILSVHPDEAYCPTEFDTKTGVVYFTNKLGVVYQEDGVTPRNIYRENDIWTDEEKVEFLLNTQWDVLVERTF